MPHRPRRHTSAAKQGHVGILARWRVSLRAEMADRGEGKRVPQRSATRPAAPAAQRRGASGFRWACLLSSPKRPRPPPPIDTTWATRSSTPFLVIRPPYRALYTPPRASTSPALAPMASSTSGSYRSDATRLTQPLPSLLRRSFAQATMLILLAPHRDAETAAHLGTLEGHTRGPSSCCVALPSMLASMLSRSLLTHTRMVLGQASPTSCSHLTRSSSRPPRTTRPSDCGRSHSCVSPSPRFPRSSHPSSLPFSHWP
jgi:hypothetical protein